MHEDDHEDTQSWTRMITSSMMSIFLSRLLGSILLILLVNLLLLVSYVGWHRIRNGRLRRKQQRKVLGFFHPYCSGGGGGERVLWKMVQVLAELNQKGFPLQVVIYTVDPPSPEYSKDLLRHVQERFAISISPSELEISFVHLHDHKHWLQPAPRLSLIVESYGTIRLAAAALAQTTAPLPDWWIDTTGCAFTFLVAKLLYGCRVMAYVHYPTISTDMLQMVWERRRTAYNHNVAIAASKLKTGIKLLYYYAVAVLYGLTGSLADLVLVNSTWTHNHIQSLWKWPAWNHRLHTVYPPCRVNDFLQTSSSTGTTAKKHREPVILSIGQFRPEKDHILQLESLAKLVERDSCSDVKLVLVGGCRNEEDEQRLHQLQELARQLGVTDRVEFVVNQPYSVVQEWLGRASVGIHTVRTVVLPFFWHCCVLCAAVCLTSFCFVQMWNEHFGIGIVEMMAAGVIVVAHNSGGPKSDIVTPHQTGYLATTADEYADALHEALTSASAETMRRKAQESSARFSDQVFDEAFQKAILSAKLLQS
jgi:alpha-1,2-mannosyltransferase